MLGRVSSFLTASRLAAPRRTMCLVPSLQQYIPAPNPQEPFTYEMKVAQRFRNHLNLIPFEQRQLVKLAIYSLADLVEDELKDKENGPSESRLEGAISKMVENSQGAAMNLALAFNSLDMEQLVNIVNIIKVDSKEDWEN
eukprot:TRINITY_DN12899_c0_g1_i1.p1 TRINITY_DN12899_c0_g1~~TRINITY_DN12899_c0_g1_i1.p1  ORF type:complete len:153 (-),score=48.44 TRINITY_DN12899_c0_g1_i1:105-524(-)